MISGPDAIVVILPPGIAANRIGIIRRETGIRVFFAILRTEGRNEEGGNPDSLHHR